MASTPFSPIIQRSPIDINADLSNDEIAFLICLDSPISLERPIESLQAHNPFNSSLPPYALPSTLDDDLESSLKPPKINWRNTPNSEPFPNWLLPTFDNLPPHRQVNNDHSPTLSYPIAYGPPTTPPTPSKVIDEFAEEFFADIPSRPGTKRSPDSLGPDQDEISPILKKPTPEIPFPFGERPKPILCYF